MIGANFWDNLVNEVESISINIRASDLRRFKASLKDKIFAMKTGSEIQRKINVTLEKEIQALKEKLEKAVDVIRLHERIGGKGMKRSEMLEKIELTLSDYLGEKINHPDHLADLILKTVETSGMLPPKSLDTVHVKKDLVKGYSIMFEWDDE